MRLLILALIISLGGCAQLKKGEMQPVKQIDIKEEIYFTTCSGMVEDWASCNKKAMQACSKGYDVLRKDENPTASRRELRFKCR
jgi:hypothetical protein